MLVVYANIFQPLIDVFEAVLKFFHNSVGLSWGWSIVAMTVAIRAADAAVDASSSSTRCRSSSSTCRS